MKFLQNITVSVAISFLLFAGGCKKDFLDAKTLSITTETTVFADSTLASQFVNARYVKADFSWAPDHLAAQAGYQVCCDEAYSAQTSTAYIIGTIKAGNLNSANVYGGVSQTNMWTTTWTYVRACNIYLSNKNTVPVKSYTKRRWEGEIRFLRAWYLFALFKHCGGLPLVRDSIFDGDKINMARNTYEETVDYISAECDTAAMLLPLSYTKPAVTDTGVSSNDYGRATKGAALALKARLWLYAASPLANDGTRTDDPNHLVSFATADPNRWKTAADAAQAVINLGYYSLYRGATPYFQQLFNQRETDEYIFVYNKANNTYLEITNSWNPPSRGGGNTSVPTQEMVDAFGMANGKAITDASSGYPGIGNSMYLNRDPRFYYSIMYNGSTRTLTGYSGAKVWTYIGVQDTTTKTLLYTSQATDKIYTGTSTGYYTFKMCYDQAVTGGAQTPRPDPLIRYAEILLDAAEAYNEYSGPSAQVYAWLKNIRDRAGIAAGTDGMYGLTAGMTQAQMRTAIWAERRVELAYEEHRYWDIRRWKIAPTLSAEVHGMEITRAANGTYSFNKVLVGTVPFTTANYYWPIPLNEITKSPKLIQNPGY